MSVDNDIAKAQRRLRELRKREAKERGEKSFAFFKNNGLEHLLKDDGEMNRFIKEIEPVLKKYRKTEEDKPQEKTGKEKKEIVSESDEE